MRGAAVGSFRNGFAAVYPQWHNHTLHQASIYARKVVPMASTEIAAPAKHMTLIF